MRYCLKKCNFNENVRILAGENHDCVKYGRIKTPYMNNPENNEFNRETAILNKHNVVNVLGYRTIKTVGTFQILSKT